MANETARRAIENACRLIETRDPAPGLAELARLAGFSPAHFQKLFVATVGVSPKAYGTTLRRRKLADALRRSRSVTDAIYDAGYSASSAAYRDSQALGMNPSRMQRGGAAEHIRYAVAQCSLGPLLIAATERGLCAVEFGAARAAVATLRGRFPDARIEAADSQLHDWVTKIVALIDQPVQAIDLPLDIRGTAFQTRVWRALTRLRPGETISYAALAQRIGAPGSARAVARACATNSLAVVVPCHRVVRGDGALAGYRWGVERKRSLLAREAQAGPPPTQPRKRRAARPSGT